MMIYIMLRRCSVCESSKKRIRDHGKVDNVFLSKSDCPVMIMFIKDSAGLIKNIWVFCGINLNVVVRDIYV